MTRCQKIRLQVVVVRETRKRWTAEQKLSIIRLTYLDGKTMSSVARQYGIPLRCFLPGDQRRGKGYWRQGTAQERKLSQPLSMHRRWMKSSALQKLLGRAVSDNELLKEASPMMSGKNSMRAEPDTKGDHFIVSRNTQTYGLWSGTVWVWTPWKKAGYQSRCYRPYWLPISSS